jgi:hypothetical protein
MESDAQSNEVVQVLEDAGFLTGLMDVTSHSLLTYLLTYFMVQDII